MRPAPLYFVQCMQHGVLTCSPRCCPLPASSRRFRVLRAVQCECGIPLQLPDRMGGFLRGRAASSIRYKYYYPSWHGLSQLSNTCELCAYCYILNLKSNISIELCMLISNPLATQNVSFLFRFKFPFVLCCAGVQVQYSVSLDSAAGRPSWLTLLQSASQDAASPVFLYGTPGEEDVGQITLNVSKILTCTATLNLS